MRLVFFKLVECSIESSACIPFFPENFVLNFYAQFLFNLKQSNPYFFFNILFIHKTNGIFLACSEDGRSWVRLLSENQIFYLSHARVIFSSLFKVIYVIISLS